jgi:hypothetical protein
VLFAGRPTLVGRSSKERVSDMFRCTIHAGAVTALLVTASTVIAQPTPTWNRKIEGVSVLPAPVAGSFFDITWFTSIDAGDLTAASDLSTELELRINGTTVHLEVQTLTANPSPHAGCAGLNCGTEPCFCTPPPVVCDCGPVIISASATTSLQPEDQIMVLLRPAAGALPDSDESDDLHILPFDGEPVFWNRRITSVEIVPSPPAGGGGDQFFEVWVETSVDGHYTGGLDLSGSLELLVNDVSHATLPLLLDDSVWSYCNPECTDTCVLAGTVPAGTCESVPNDCICQMTPSSLVFPTVPLEPDDVITVILRPAPGALPELPGFPDDEEDRPVCPWDCGDGDFIVGILDFLAMLAQWGEVGAPCDFDGGGVGVTDFLKLLGQWGPCFPQ